MAPKITVPLFITCERCEAIKQVKNRTVQRLQRFCSKHCATKACCSHPFNKEAQSRGGKMRASRMRTALMVKVGHLGPVEAFRLGYARGLQSKWRQTRNRRKVAA
jgi:hypothetical protein